MEEPTCEEFLAVWKQLEGRAGPVCGRGSQKGRDDGDRSIQFWLYLRMQSKWSAFSEATLKEMVWL